MNKSNAPSLQIARREAGSWFPITIQLSDGTTKVCNHPSDTPQGVAFRVIGTTDNSWKFFEIMGHHDV